MSPYAIEVSSVGFSIAGQAILRDISFSVERGEFWSIIGPNGAGKTTLLKCIDRVEHDWSGSIRIHGRNLADYSQRDLARRLSYVPQAGGRHYPFTVHEFILMGRYPHLSPFSSIRQDDERVVREVMERTDTARFADRLLRTLSGGERQKVHIAAALAQGGDVLLLDEPTTFLDYRHQADVLSLLKRLNEESGVTILQVTHDINCALLMSDRVLAIRKGAVAFCGEARELLDRERLREIYEASFHLMADQESGRTVVAPQGMFL